MYVHPEFPEHRRRDPRYREELLVYEAIQASGADGIALYGARLDCQRLVVDLLTLITDVARFGLEVQGRQYKLEGTAWQRLNADTWDPTPDPLAQARDAAMHMRNALGKHLAHKPFTLPVVTFPDMEQDQGIEARANRAEVHALFGVDQLVERLTETGENPNIFHLPTREKIVQEAESVMPGARAVEAPSPQGRHTRRSCMPSRTPQPVGLNGMDRKRS